MRLPHAFYARSTLEVAYDLLGKVVVHVVDRTTTAGAIVEVEVYIGEDDPACHAASGPTRRNAPLYGPPGFAYVYFNYGMHCLLNAVTEEEGHPAAVLIRALAPLDGLETMRARRLANGRRVTPIADHDLCRGPGNLTRALGITLAENRADLTGPRLFIEDRDHEVGEVRWSPRIGIRVGTERLWRASVIGHPAVSRR